MHHYNQFGFNVNQIKTPDRSKQKNTIKSSEKIRIEQMGKKYTNYSNNKEKTNNSTSDITDMIAADFLCLDSVTIRLFYNVVL